MLTPQSPFPSFLLSIKSPFSSASSVCVLLPFCPFHPFLFHQPLPSSTLSTLIPNSTCVLTCLFIPLSSSALVKHFQTLSCSSMVQLLHPCPQDICPWAASACCYPQSACPNLPSRMMMHSRMAIRAPVLRPAEERNASPWHIRILPWRWHGHTRSVKVLVPLSDGSPLSQTTMGSSYSSWVRWLKRRRLAMMLAVLSTMGEKKKRLLR